MILKPARLILALVAVAAAPAFAQNVATVNGKAIPASRVDQVVKQVVAQGKQPDSPQLREAIKKDLIGREVLIQEADKQGYGTRPEVKAQLDNARQSIIINALLADYVKKNPVKDAEIKAEYDKFKAQAGDKEYHARHILVATEAEAKDIIAKLKGGAKFEELAKVSKDGSAANGGDLDWASPSFVRQAIRRCDGGPETRPGHANAGAIAIRLPRDQAGRNPPDQAAGTGRSQRPGG